MYISISSFAQILLEKLDALETDRQFTKHFNFITKLSKSKAAEDIKCPLHASLRKIKKMFHKRFLRIYAKNSCPSHMCIECIQCIHYAYK